MFRATNNDRTTTLYYNHRLYWAALRPYVRSNSNLINFNVGEKFLYGRVDHYYTPLVTYTPVFFEDLLSARPPVHGQASLSAFGFVVEAFTQLQMHFRLCAQRGQISSKEKYLSTIEPYRAYENPHRLYATYADTYDNTLVAHLKDPTLKILDFRDFVREIKLLLYKGGPTYPYTTAGYIKSRTAPIFISGLAIEIADLKYDDDVSKVAHFIRSSNWEFYLKTCSAFGFMVDANIPWRLVADLNSPTMRLFSSRFNQRQSARTLFRQLYRPVAQSSFLDFRERLMALYNKSAKTGFTEGVYCDGRYVTKVLKPRKYTPEALLQEFDTDYFLNFYMELRFAENEIQYPEEHRDRLIHLMIEQSKIKGVYYALLLLERFLGKPFDYSGSMNYYRESLEAIIREQDQETVGGAPSGPAPTSNNRGGY